MTQELVSMLGRATRVRGSQGKRQTFVSLGKQKTSTDRVVLPSGKMRLKQRKKKRIEEREESAVVILVCLSWETLFLSWSGLFRLP